MALARTKKTSTLIQTPTAMLGQSSIYNREEDEYIHLNRNNEDLDEVEERGMRKLYSKFWRKL